MHGPSPLPRQARSESNAASAYLDFGVGPSQEYNQQQNRQQNQSPPSYSEATMWSFYRNRDSDLESGVPVVEDDRENFPVVDVHRSSTTGAFSITLPRKVIKGIGALVGMIFGYLMLLEYLKFGSDGVSEVLEAIAHVIKATKAT